MKHMTKHTTEAAYEAVLSTLHTPNVALIQENLEIHYNPYVGTWVICKYNVTSTSSPTVLRTTYKSNVFRSMEIDGIMLDELVTEYTFDTTGVHTVKYELYDDTKLGNNTPVFYSSNLIECIIPDSVKSIGLNAFGGCSSLTSITIPDSVTSIGDCAFQYCSKLTSITIGNSVASIGDRAFLNCSSLTSITSLATTAPTIIYSTFLNVKTGGTLTVPIGSSGYDVWMSTGTFYLGQYGWTKAEQ